MQRRNRTAVVSLIAMLGIGAFAAPPPDGTSRDEIYLPIDYPRWIFEEAGDLTVTFTSLNCAGGKLEVNYRVDSVAQSPVHGNFKTLVTVGGQAHPDTVQNPHEIFGPLYTGTAVHLSTFEPGPGTYSVVVETDYEHAVFELDENNNIAASEVTCLE